MDKKLLNMHQTHYNNLLKEIKNKEKLVKIEENFTAVYTYDAISLEGKNKIPFEDVKRLLKTGLILNYTEREQKEVLNHNDAYLEIKQMHKSNIDLDEEKIKDLHEILVKDIFQGGIYRNVNIQIPDAIHQPPNHIKVYDRMKKLFENNEIKKLDDFNKGLRLHAEIAKIHPFLDANGRLARLVLNYYLLKSGYIAISIPIDKRDEYFANLEKFKVEKDIMPLNRFIIKLLNERYEKIIKKLEI